MMKQKEQGLINIAAVARVTAIIVGVVIVILSAFFVFRTRILADQAFRDAKNVYLALSAAEIEYYSRGKSIYDPTKYNGLAEGVEERVRNLVDNEGYYRVISYNGTTHTVTGMIYYNGNYYVTYSDDNGKTTWEVKYLMPIYKFEE